MRLESIEALRGTLGVSPSARIAIVGNSSSQFGLGHGAEIDAHDVVVRLNYGQVIHPADQGTRTDVLGCSDPKITLARIRETFQPRVAIWLTSKEPPPGFFNDDELPVLAGLLGNWETVAQYVQPARPSTGALAAHLFRVTLGFSNVSLYGFDFFVTPTFYHRRSLRFWRKKREIPHSGVLEQRMVEALGIRVCPPPPPPGTRLPVDD